jgi:hypothetical protein
MEKTRILATVAMVLMVPVMIYYPYHGLWWNLELSFLDMGKWTRNSAWVHPSAEIAMTTRVVFFVLWVIPTILGLLGYLAGFRALLLFRQGIVFDTRIASRLFWMGVFISSSSFIALVAGAVSPMIRSWHNPAGPLPLRIWYDSGNFGLMFSGLAFVFLGIVLREAINIARENEEFV